MAENKKDRDATQSPEEASLAGFRIVFGDSFAHDAPCYVARRARRPRKDG